MIRVDHWLSSLMLNQRILLREQHIHDRKRICRKG